MAGATRRSPFDLGRAIRDNRGAVPEGGRGRFPQLFPRVINVAWASIADGDLLPGELVANRNDNSLVWRADNTNIYRYDDVATRAI